MRVERIFILRISLLALAVRIIVVSVLKATNLIYTLRLSPDSERYHREAITINHLLAFGVEPHYRWQDDAWFRFTALIYRYLGEQPLYIQAINIAFATVTVALSHRLALAVSGNLLVARMTAIFCAFNPALVYWSCLMLKDPAGIFAMTLLVLAAVELRRQSSMFWLVGACAALTIFLGIRSYMFLVLGMIFSLCMIAFRPLSQVLSLRNIACLALVTIALPNFLGQGTLGLDFYRNARYFDLEYINHVRVAMGDHGKGRIFEDDVAIWGSDMISNLSAALRTAFYFFFVIDIADIASTRQLMALPEAIFILVFFPALAAGSLLCWRRREILAPLAVFGLGAMSVYISATTNMGALFRWKMQIMPIIGILVSLGIASLPRIRMYSWIQHQILSRLRIQLRDTAWGKSHKQHHE